MHDKKGKASAFPFLLSSSQARLQFLGRLMQGCPRRRQLTQHIEQSEVVDHAGIAVRHRDGRLEGAADPRSDGSAEVA